MRSLHDTLVSQIICLHKQALLRDQKACVVTSCLRADIKEWGVSNMEPIEVDSSGNRVGPHVWKHYPVPISEEGQGVLPDNGVQTIACRPKQGGPAVSRV